MRFEFQSLGLSIQKTFKVGLGGILLVHLAGEEGTGLGEVASK